MHSDENSRTSFAEFPDFFVGDPVTGLARHDGGDRASNYRQQSAPKAGKEQSPGCDPHLSNPSVKSLKNTYRNVALTKYGPE